MKTPSYLPLISMKSGWKYFQLKSALTMSSSGGREGRVFTLDHAGQRSIEKSNKNSAYNLTLFLQLVHTVTVLYTI